MNTSHPWVRQLVWPITVSGMSPNDGSAFGFSMWHYDNAWLMAVSEDHRRGGWSLRRRRRLRRQVQSELGSRLVQLWRWRVGPATPLIVQTPEHVVDQSGQRAGRAVDGVVQGGSLVRDCDGLAAFEAGLHHAALVVLTLLVAVFIAQVDFHPCDAITEVAQGTFHDAADASRHRLVTRDVIVGIHLDLHAVLPL
jgi:hypothetical protein